MKTEIEDIIENIKKSTDMLKAIREERERWEKGLPFKNKEIEKRIQLHMDRDKIDHWVKNDGIYRIEEIKPVIDEIKEIRKNRELTREECDFYLLKIEENSELWEKEHEERMEQIRKRIKECDENIALYSKKEEQLQEIRKEYMSGKYTFEQSVRKAQPLGIEVPQYVLDRVDEIEKEKLSQLNPMGGIH